MAQLAKFEASPGVVGLEASAALRAHIEQSHVQLMADATSHLEGSGRRPRPQLKVWERSASLGAAP